MSQDFRDPYNNHYTNGTNKGNSSLSFHPLIRNFLVILYPLTIFTPDKLLIVFYYIPFDGSSGFLSVHTDYRYKSNINFI